MQQKLSYRLALSILGFGLAAAPAFAASEQLEPHEPIGGWKHAGMTGTFDRAALQRGYQVYKEVCSACHAMHLVSFRNLQDIGFSEEQVKAIAAGYQVQGEPDDNGDVKMRAALPADRFVKPFANEKAARAANNGAYPPDLSLMVKARHGGEDYVYSLLTGYGTPPEEVKLNPGMNYNPYFPGGQIAMAPPLTEGAVTYADGTKATVEQMAHDVATFLTWTAEPKLEVRKQTGLKVMLFLFVFAGVMYAVKRRVWSKLH